MSSYVPGELKGRIFDNTQDKRSTRSPDYTGLVQVNGVVFRVAGWYNPPSEKVRKSNISLTFSDKRKYDEEQKRKREERDQEDLGNDTPF